MTELRPASPRFRFLYQYRLRTLLLVTAGVAVFCNWYFQPQRKDDLLAGGKMKVRRQVRVAKADEPQDPFGDSPDISHGLWQLLDDHELRLVSGGMRDGSAAGRWTAWYPGGQKSAEGVLRGGVRVGLWRTWHENGRLKAEVMYDDRPERVYDIAFEEWLHSGVHHGPARAWHENGQLRLEGNYGAGLPQGAWTFYDDAGRVTAAGRYLNGKRHGPWKIASPTRRTGFQPVQPLAERADYLEVAYVHGFRQDELNELHEQLAAGLNSPQRYRRHEAASGLDELGPAALPLVQKILAGDGPRSVPATDSPSAKELAIQALWRFGPAGKEALPLLKRLAAGDDAPLAEKAGAAIYMLDDSNRAASYGPLLSAIATWPDRDAAIDALISICRHDPARRRATIRAAVELAATWPGPEQEQAAVRLATLPDEVLDLLESSPLSDDIRFRRLEALILLTVVTQSWSRETSHAKRLERRIELLRTSPDPEVSVIGKELYERRGGGGGGMGGGGGGGFQ